MEGDKGLILRLMSGRWPKTSIGAIMLDRVQMLVDEKAIASVYGDIVSALRTEGWSAQPAMTVLDEIVVRRARLNR